LLLFVRHFFFVVTADCWPASYTQVRGAPASFKTLVTAVFLCCCVCPLLGSLNTGVLNTGELDAGAVDSVLYPTSHKVISIWSVLHSALAFPCWAVNIQAQHPCCLTFTSVHVLPPRMSHRAGAMAALPKFTSHKMRHIVSLLTLCFPPSLCLIVPVLLRRCPSSPATFPMTSTVLLVLCCPSFPVWSSFLSHLFTGQVPWQLCPSHHTCFDMSVVSHPIGCSCACPLRLSLTVQVLWQLCPSSPATRCASCVTRLTPSPTLSWQQPTAARAAIGWAAWLSSTWQHSTR
jgi:hypothetical protein